MRSGKSPHRPTQPSPSCSITMLGAACGCGPIMRYSSRREPRSRKPWSASVIVAASDTFITVYDPHEFPQTLLHRIPRRIELRLCPCIVRAAGIEDGDEVGHGFAVLCHRAEIALLHHAAHVLVGTRLDPHRVGATQQ